MMNSNSTEAWSTEQVLDQIERLTAERDAHSEQVEQIKSECRRIAVLINDELPDSWNAIELRQLGKTEPF